MLARWNLVKLVFFSKAGSRAITVICVLVAAWSFCNGYTTAGEAALIYGCLFGLIWLIRKMFEEASTPSPQHYELEAPPDMPSQMSPGAGQLYVPQKHPGDRQS